MAAPPTASILLVDGDQPSLTELSEFLREQGYRVKSVATGQEALGLLDESVDVVLADMHVAPLTGVDLVEQGKARAPQAVFMVMTERGEVASAVDAIKRGADQYLLKPLNRDALRALVEAGVRRASQHRELLELRQTRLAKRTLTPLGTHPLMQRVLKMVNQVAPRRASVLLRGETGTGKELVARLLHEKSGRSGAFVALNCAALSESILESELFGHEKGAFTGAFQRREGRFQQADGGTLFLDEVSEIPSNVQVKLLRFLQERQYERVGSNRTETVDVRVVAACNVDLMTRVREGRFREDLFYRLNVVEISLPPLRARINDVPTLAEHFVRQACLDNQQALVPILSGEVLQRLCAYSWPGNVRELQNAMERAVVVCETETILLDDLPGTLRDEKLAEDPRLTLVGMTLAELERWAVLRTLEAVQWSPAKAAELLGVSTRTIQYRLREWKIDRAELSAQVRGEGDEELERPN